MSLQKEATTWLTKKKVMRMEVETWGCEPRNSEDHQRCWNLSLRVSGLNWISETEFWMKYCCIVLPNKEGNSGLVPWETVSYNLGGWNQIDYILCSQRRRSSIQSAKARPGADCGSDHELLIAKFRLKLKEVVKTSRPFRYDLNQIPYDYTVDVRNRFKGLDLIDRVPDR